MASPQSIQELRVVMVGKTGKGKSTLGNSLLGRKGYFPTSPSGKSKTSHCSYGDTTLSDGTILSVVDTPGLFDTTVTTRQTQEELGKCIGLSSPGPHVFIFVVRIGRFTTEELETIERLIDFFGEDVMKHVLVIFTGKDDLEESNMTIDEYVEDVPQELTDLLQRCRRRYAAINNRASPEEVQHDINYIIGLIKKTIRINGGNHYTGEMFKLAEACLKDKIKAKEEAGLTEAEARSEVRNEVSAGQYLQEILRVILPLVETAIKVYYTRHL